MMRQIGKKEHEEALRHVEQLVMKNQRATLQTTLERIKHPIGQPKLQSHMTLQTLGRHIKQESEEGTSNQESKKHQRGTYT